MTVLDRPIRTLADLTAAWRFIDGNHGYDAPQVFALLIDRHARLMPAIVHVYDSEIDEGLDELAMSNLVRAHGEIIRTTAPGASLALMRARPGGAHLTEEDRAWCGMVHRLLVEAPFGTKPLFFATDRSVGVVPPDVLVGATG